MARHADRIRLLNHYGFFLGSESITTIYHLVAQGKAEWISANEAQLVDPVVAATKVPRPSAGRSPATITFRELEANAGAPSSHARNPRLLIRRAREKVAAWPSTHDDYAPTIAAGKSFMPNLRAATKRAKLVERSSKLSRQVEMLANRHAFRSIAYA